MFAAEYDVVIPGWLMALIGAVVLIAALLVIFRRRK